MTTARPTKSVQRPDWLPESEYPFQLRSVGLGGETVTYIDEGRGPTLLFVHTGMWSFVFRDVITRLKGDFRCIALDFPGFGLAPEPIGELGLEAQAELLGQFAIELNLTDITLVLHDLGGPVGIGFAASHPGLIRGMVLANTFAWKPDSKGLVRMLRIVSSRPVTALDRVTRLVPRLTASKAGVGRWMGEASKRAFLGPFQQAARVERFHRLMKDALGSDSLYAETEAAIRGPLNRLPVLTIFGERNDPFGFQARHAATFADHEGLVIAKGNHFPMMDDPDLFADTVSEWVGRKFPTLAQRR